MPKAVRIYKTGGPEVLQLEDTAVGDPGAGEVRLRHRKTSGSVVMVAKLI